MNNLVMLVQLSENDKRILISLLILLILVFVLVGYLGYLITKVMKWQGKAADAMMHDLVVTQVVTNTKEFNRVARKKNSRYLFKQAKWPLLIVIVPSIFIVIYLAVTKQFGTFDFFDYSANGTGINTLFFIWDFDNAKYTTVFGITVLQEWPPLLSSPHLSINAWPSYVFWPVFIVGACWYLVCIQSYISRSFRLYKLSKQVFNKSLENFDSSITKPIPQGLMKDPTQPQQQGVQGQNNNNNNAQN